MPTTPIATRLQLLVIALLCLANSTASGDDEPTRRIRLDANTPTLEVNSYFSLQAHGPTKKFFTVADSQAVVMLVTKDGTAEASGKVVLFPPATTAEGLEKWLNNQHSDALYIDAAEPLRTFAIPKQHLRTEVSAPLAHEVGRGGDEYDEVRVDYAVSAFRDGDALLEPFRGTLKAFVRTKPLN